MISIAILFSFFLLLLLSWIITWIQLMNWTVQNRYERIECPSYCSCFLGSEVGKTLILIILQDIPPFLQCQGDYVLHTTSIHYILSHVILLYSTIALNSVWNYITYLLLFWRVRWLHILRSIVLHTSSWPKITCHSPYSPKHVLPA